MAAMSMSYQSFRNDRMVRITEDGNDLWYGIGNRIGLCFSESSLPFSSY